MKKFVLGIALGAGFLGLCANTNAGGGARLAATATPKWKWPAFSVKMGRLSGGAISTGETKFQTALRVAYDEGETDRSCQILSYTCYYDQIREAEVKTFHVQGAAFSPELLKMTQNARIGDRFQFVDIRVSCAGASDDARTPIPALAFMVK